jgi:hypothetical protein
MTLAEDMLECCSKLNSILYSILFLIVVRLKNPSIGHSCYSAHVLDVGSSLPKEERIGL